MIGSLKFKYPSKIFKTILLFLCTALSAEERVLTDIRGRTVTVNIISVDSISVTATRISDGKTFSLPLEKLCQADRSYLLNLAQKTPLSSEDPSEKIAQLNQIIGLPFFQQENHDLWDNSSKDLSSRLEWPLESSTEFDSSHRIYFKEDQRLLGCRPYTACLYSRENKPALITILYANKGDFASDHNQLKRQIQNDAEQITTQLNQSLQEPIRDSIGKGKGFYQRVWRWNWENTAFILAEEPEDYLALYIMPTALADQKGQFNKRSPKVVRKRVLNNIEERENGDKILKNLPMVDQGPKGYCVPATFERYLRYLDIPADMYLIAMNAETSAGGGTSMNSFLEGIRSYARRFNISMKTIKKKVGISEVARYIDRGVPIAWTHFSSTPFNKIAKEQTATRANVQNWEEESSSFFKQVKDAAMPKDGPHIALIHGYNRQTKEIAFTDSWGPRFQERWIFADLAEKASQGSFYLIGI